LIKWKILGGQINSMPLSLINFRKFITGDEKRVLYVTLKEEVSWFNYRHRSRNPIFTQKSFGV